MRVVRTMAVVGAGLALAVPLALILASPGGADTLINGASTLTTIGSVTSGTPYSSGQNVNITEAANSTLSLSNLENFGYTGEPSIKILECADSGGTTTNLPTTETNECDGQTQLSTTAINSNGSFTFNGYTIYALPDVPTFGESPTQKPACSNTSVTECVLFIGPDPGNFAQPHVFSAPFSVKANSSDSGASPGDGELAPLTSQTITFTSNAPNPGQVGNTYTPTATGGASGSPVIFSIGSASPTGACTISGSVVSFKADGTCVVDANQSGNDVNGTDYSAAAQKTQSITISGAASPQPQTISFTSTKPNPGIVGNTYTPHATGGGSGNPVVFSIGSSSTAGACSLSSGVVSFNDTGTCVVDANQAGDASYTVAPEVDQSITVAVVAITTTSVPPATLGNSYTATITAEGGHTPYKWKLTSAKSSLPKGLKFKNGVLSGIPKTGKKADVPGQYSFSVSVATKKYNEGSGKTKTKVPSFTATASFTLTLDS